VTVYHSPRCRIGWTNVVSDGVDRNVVIPDRPLTLFFGLEFDNNIRFQGGEFYLRWVLIHAVSGQIYSHLWSGWTPTQMPSAGGNIWVSTTWSQATILTNGARGMFLYQPRASFWIIPPGGGFSGDDEFAVAEEDHYILFE
jgi:hypothetical protein